MGGGGEGGGGEGGGGEGGGGEGSGGGGLGGGGDGAGGSGKGGGGKGGGGEGMDGDSSGGEGGGGEETDSSCCGTGSVHLHSTARHHLADSTDIQARCGSNVCVRPSWRTCTQTAGSQLCQGRGR